MATRKENLNSSRETSGWPLRLLRRRPIELALLLMLLWPTWLFLSGLVGPGPAATPLEVPLSLATAGERRYEFSVEREAEYSIWVSVKEVFSPAEMRALVGESSSPSLAAPRFHWSVFEKGDRIATGAESGRQEPKLARSAERWSLILGSFDARPAAEYILSLNVLTAEPRWDEADPVVSVGDMNAREPYLGRQLRALYMGIPLILILFGVIVVRAAIARFRDFRPAA